MPALARDECWMNEDWQRFLAQLLCQLLHYILAGSCCVRLLLKLAVSEPGLSCSTNYDLISK